MKEEIKILKILLIINKTDCISSKIKGCSVGRNKQKRLMLLSNSAICGKEKLRYIKNQGLY